MRLLPGFLHARHSVRWPRNLPVALISKDTVKIGKTVLPIVSGMASRMGIYHEEDVAELTEIIAAAIVSGRLRVPFLVSAFLPPGSQALTEMGVKNPPTANEASAHFLVALAEQWVASYKKPVLTTTFFTVDQPRPRGHSLRLPFRQACRQGAD